MKPNQKNRYNNRYNNNRNYRPQQLILRNTALDSNGPCGKLHGTALQLFEKYQMASKDAALQNDAVLAEMCLQFADHYMRLQNTAIANEENLRNRAPVQQNKPQETTAATPAAEDELPDFGVPTTTSDTAPAIDSLSDEDEAIKNMDLSIPILAIQEKHQDTKPQRGPRPMRKPRTPGKSAPTSNEIPTE